MTVRRYPAVTLCLVVCVGMMCAQDSVDVTFRYQIAGKTGVALPGEFNGWTPAAAPMTSIGGDVWIRTVRLRVGGNPAPPSNGVPGAWQYKFWYTGVSDWPNDPLNHHQNPLDNNNTFLYVKDPTIYQLVPNQRGPILNTSTPIISAYIFPRVGSAVDTATLALIIDGTVYAGAGTAFHTGSSQLVFTPPQPLVNGEHTLILRAGTNADTVRFTTRTGYLQVTTIGGFATVNTIRTIRGIVQDTTVTSVAIVRNGTDTTRGTVSGGEWALTDTLTEGLNAFVAVADSAGQRVVSDPVSFTLYVSHAPVAHASATLSGSSVALSAAGTTDPDGQTITDYTWLDDPLQPLGINNTKGVAVNLTVPGSAGDYTFGLIARDPTGNCDTTWSYFIVNTDGSVTNPTVIMNPLWAQMARVYFLFPKAASPAGTLVAAAQRLPTIHDMGFNVIWMMPVMKNAFPINNGISPGYNITDFYNVAPEYGTNQDFKNFIAQAHTLGMKVILDVTTNHSSRSHPWAIDARTFGIDSRYWEWYEHTIIPHSTNGLGQSTDAYGFTYYTGFSDQLLNLNWRDPDFRAEMIHMLRYWITEFGLDGYRYDVYWGPHRRYGEAAMGKPVREALKHTRADIFLLGEDDGTGGGTEAIYADYMSEGVYGGVDAAYDFKLYFNRVRGFSFTPFAINNLHNEIDNAGFYPGENALYMRFMESQDEDRIVYFYSSAFALDAATTFQRTMPMATVLFTAPGFPMLWNGQEVGWGYGITGSKEARTRSVIDWNYQGRGILSPHYQKLATLRGQFRAFTQHRRDTNGDGRVDGSDVSDFVRVGSTNENIYAFARPYINKNGLSVTNMSSEAQTGALDLLSGNALTFDSDIKPLTKYYVNELLTNTHSQMYGSALSALPVALPPYGSAVYTISSTSDTLKILNPVQAVEGAREVPFAFALHQNYPNPFNPSTVIAYDLPHAVRVMITVHDLLGREVIRLVDADLGAGNHVATWNGRNGTGMPAASGVYFCRMLIEGPTGRTVFTRKLVLMK
jgi:glycosidase